jgi:hypothetical protein
MVRFEKMLETGANDRAERDAISDSLTHLQTLKRERLGFHGLPLIDPLRGLDTGSGSI